MLNSALELDDTMQNNSDLTIFEDNTFNNEIINDEDENLFVTIQTTDLSDAKKIFGELSISKKILAIRYIFSRRILQTELLSNNEKLKLKVIHEESYGSLCAINDKGTETITLESQIITRVLYITESMSLQEYHRMKHELVQLVNGYHVIMQVINNRLNFHKMNE